MEFNNNALDLAKRGVSKQYILSILTNSWELSDNELIICEVTAYYNRRWKSEHVRDTIYNGIITSKDNIEFAVIYRNCTPAKMLFTEYINLSFRASTSGNFVIIQPLTNKE